MCPGIGAVDAGRVVADRIVASIRGPIRAVGHTVSVGASVGVALGAQPLIPSVLVQRADEALLDAKQSGKNLVRVAA
jgi:PleD family two-component response regulator